MNFVFYNTSNIESWLQTYVDRIWADKENHKPLREGILLTTKMPGFQSINGKKPKSLLQQLYWKWKEAYKEDQAAHGYYKKPVDRKDLK